MSEVCELMDLLQGNGGNRAFLMGDFYILEYIILSSVVVRYFRVKFYIFFACSYFPGWKLKCVELTS